MGLKYLHFKLNRAMLFVTKLKIGFLIILILVFSAILFLIFTFNGKITGPLKILFLNYNILTFVLVLILAGSTWGIGFTVTIAKNIKNLTKALQEISKGNLNAKLEIKSKDEIGEMARNINQLSDILKKKEDEVKKALLEAEISEKVLKIRVDAKTRELRELGKNLENQVEERTREIQDKVKELEQFRELTLGREMEMIKLKEEIKRLKEKLGEKTEEI